MARDVEPMPPSRRPEPAPARRPPPERGYDRADLREPPRNEGGPLRAIILVALLGGAALAGGLYFGGGMSDFGTGQQEQAQDVEPLAPVGEAADSAENLDEPVGIPIDENSAAPPAPERRAERREEPAPRREPERTAARETTREPEPPTPAPRTSWSGGSGPVSLSPTTGSAPTPSTSAPANLNAPPTPVDLSASTNAAPSRASAPRGSVIWAQRPSVRRLGDLFPARALNAGVGGRAELDCTIRGDQSVACTVASESPAGMGFGRAALSAANSYRARATLSDGSSSVGARTRIAVQFQVPE